MLNPTRLLLDENLSWRVACGLKQSGYSATTIGEHGLTSLHDNAIFQFAQSQSYVLLTRDSDFLTLFPPPHKGIIVIHAPAHGTNYDILQCLLGHLPTVLQQDLTNIIEEINC